MKAVVLAAGYATRLYPLTETIAKPLLPVGGRPMLDHLLDRIREVGEIDAVHVVTNAKFAAAFAAWAAARPDVVVHDDGTTSEDDRLGAIGDVAFVIDAAGLDGEELLVVAGDNLFDFSLAEYVAWWRTKGEASAVALHDVGDLELATRYGIVALGAGERVESFEEKPAEPRSTLAATATYLYHRAHVPLVRRYLAEGNSPDQPGRFIAWLAEREPVYGYRFAGDWRDIGDARQLLEADNRLRELSGLPPRDAYALD
ncbi:MAG TPA: nucleotidyltransferase family protein [Gaiellaceae bacterium]|nr:nucleotidyltransferase family protein [Gaiellaceae bacterium]